MFNATIAAAVQFEPKILDVQKNLSTARYLAHEAAAKGASVVVLPELCISGYVLRNKQEASQCAQTRDGYQTEAFLPIAKQYNCHIVVGYVELNEGKLYNSAVVVGPNGVSANFQKHNLWANDYLWAESSEAFNPVVITRAGRLGALICRDAMNVYRESYKFYKEDQKFYRKGSVDTIALLTNWGGNVGHPDHTWVELAEQTNANIIVSNRVGKERDLTFKGGSCIVTRNKQVYTHGSSFLNEAVVGGIIEL
jgi:N-carbamoylputrescine amidase